MIDWAGNSGISFFFSASSFSSFIGLFFLLCVALFSNMMLLLLPFFCFSFHTRLVGDCVCILFSVIFRFKCFIIFTFTKRVFSYDFFYFFFFFSNIHCSLCLVFRIKSTHSISILYTYVHTYDKRMGRFK